MTEATPITIPLLNPNEPGALLAALHIKSGQYVRAGEKLCTLETTKSTAELLAEKEGYIVGLAFQTGQTINAGETLGYIAGSPDWSPPAQVEITPATSAISMEGIRISQPALRLARQHNLDLAKMPGDVFITEKMVQELINGATKPEALLQTEAFAPNAIIVYGGGGHGKALIDLIRAEGSYSLVGIVDDDVPAGTLIMNVPVLGGEGILKQLLERGVCLAANAVGGIGNIQTRIKMFERLSQAGFTCPTLIHPRAFIEPSARLAEGIQVMPHAYVGSETEVGYGVIVNTGAIVSHDCRLGDYANLSPGAILAGEVNIGSAVLVGMGVTINLRVRVGDRARIGNGATVKQDVPEGAVVHAGSTWPG